VMVGFATGEAREPPLRPTFDRRIKLEFHGARITWDGGVGSAAKCNGGRGVNGEAAERGRRPH
jgi:hypothetical protein